MKKILILSAIVISLLSSCGNNNEVTLTTTEPKLEVTTENNLETNKDTTISVVDSLGNKVTFEEMPTKTVALGSSITEVWLLAEGELLGTTSDSIERLELEHTANIGTINNPNVEEIMKNDTELVLMSSTIPGHTEIVDVLKAADIDVLFCDINSFTEYLYVLNMFTKINGTEELYKTYGTEVGKEITEYTNKAKQLEAKTGLFLRASSVSLKALPDDNFSVKIMENMGIKNIADESLLEDLSIETILEKDPYYIFLVIMGNDEQAGVDMYETYIKENPAFNTLTAVKEDRVILLPKELFHNKPNNRWDEAYGYIYDIRADKE